MSCKIHKNINCECDAISLSDIDVYLRKEDDIFLFAGLLEGTDIDYETTPNGIVISAVKNEPRFSVGLNPISLSGNATLTNSIFNNFTIPGFVNTGLLNTSNSVPNIVLPGLYLTDVQITALRNSSNILINEFSRQFVFLVNNVAIDPVVSRVSFSNETMTLSAKLLLFFNPGDLFTFEINLGGAGSLYSLSGISSFYSMRRI